MNLSFQLMNLNRQLSGINPKSAEGKKQLDQIEKTEIPKFLQASAKEAPLATEFLKTFFNENNTGSKTFDLQKSGTWKFIRSGSKLWNIDSYFGFPKDGEQFKDEFSSKNSSRKKTTAKKIKDLLKDVPVGKTITVPPDSWDTLIHGESTNTNIYYALGSFTLNGKFEGKATKLANGKIKVEGQITYKVFDTYDWNQGQQVSLPLAGKIRINDSSLQKFEDAGLAKSFKVESTPVSEKVNVTI
jgi:predicted heme/steroid binding protein